MALVRPEISVIIPVGTEEALWETLFEDLNQQSEPLDVIVCCAEGMAEKLSQRLQLQCAEHGYQLIQSPPGRGRQVNAAATTAQTEFLWLLHADSRVPASAAERLLRKAKSQISGVLYCDIKFTPPRPQALGINEFGVYVRSRLFNLPFGDQGFFLKRELFLSLGAFDSHSTPGEDLRFIRRARRQRVPIIPAGLVIQTSPRKYLKDGWLRTTLAHLWQTARQGLTPSLRSAEAAEERH